MRIEILDAAEQDLIDGFNFYEIKSQGLGQPAEPKFEVRGVRFEILMFELKWKCRQGDSLSPLSLHPS